MGSENLLLETATKLMCSQSLYIEDRYIFPIEDIVNAMLNADLQSQHNLQDAIKSYGHMVNQMSDDCIWFWFESPDWTWKNSCGRAGWMAISKSDLKLVDFFLEIMN